MRADRLAARYASLEDRLAGLELYHEPINLPDFAPADRWLRYQYIHELVLPFPVEKYMYNHGNNVGSFVWVWKVPSDPAESNNQKSTALVNALVANIPRYHTRAMPREFLHRYDLLLHAPPSILHDMY